MRIKSLLVAETELLKILPKHPNFAPPPVLPLVDVSSWQPSVPSAPKAANPGKSGGVTKKGKSTAVRFGKSKGPGAR
jgi:hypothetical protein